MHPVEAGPARPPARSSSSPPRGLGWYRDPAIWMGGAGVLCFSFTFPATHIADPAFGGVTVGLGRAILAAILAAGVLLIRRDPLPPRHTWAGLGWTAAGVVVGFPLFSALALEGTPVAQSAILMGLLPLATTTYAVMRERAHPPVQFWLSRLAGMMAVVLFALGEGMGHVQAGDGWMLLAVGTGAMGYAEGGRLARELGGWRVICWALVFAAPLLVGPVGWSLVVHGLHSDLWAWLCLAYVSIFSMFLGFFAWYQGLALGGIARISQLQLFQPLLTIGWAVLFLGERITFLSGIAAVFVVGCVVVGQRGTFNVQKKEQTDAPTSLATSSAAFRTRGTDRETDTTSKIVCVSSPPSARTPG